MDSGVRAYSTPVTAVPNTFVTHALEQPNRRACPGFALVSTALSLYACDQLTKCLDLSALPTVGQQRPQPALRIQRLLILGESDQILLHGLGELQEIHGLRNPSAADSVPPRDLRPRVNLSAVQTTLELIRPHQRGHPRPTGCATSTNAFSDSETQPVRQPSVVRVYRTEP